MSRDLEPPENELRPSSRRTWLTVIVVCAIVAGLVGWTTYTVSLTTAHHQAVEDQRTALRNEQLATVERDLALTSIRSMVVELHNKLDGDPRQRELEPSVLELAMEALAPSTSASNDIAAAESENRIGELYVELGRIDDAEEHLQRAATICRELLGKTPNDFAASQCLALTQCHLGDVAHARSETDPAAEKYYREALRLNESLLKRTDAPAVTQRRVAIVYDRLGDLHRRRQQLVLARDAYSRSAKVAKAARAQQIDHGVDRVLVATYLKLGAVGIALGDRRQADQSFQDAYDFSKQLAGINPRNVRAQRDLAMVLDQFSRYAMQKGELGQAIEFAKSRQHVIETSRRLEPANLTVQRDEVAVHRLLADLSLRQQKLDNAQSASEAALRLAEELVIRRDARLDDLLEYFAAQRQAILVHAASGRVADAEQRLVLLRQWIDSLPDRVSVPADQSAAWQNRLRTDFQQLEGRLPSASK